MAVTIKQIEAMPETYPDAPTMNAAATALDADLIWQRIETYVSHRWSERAVVWMAEGPGCWEPPLTPATITKAEIWRNGDWDELTLPTSPMGGYMLAGKGPYRFTGTAGDDDADVPAAVLEAFKRLAEYSAQSKGKAGARSERIGAGSISLSHNRHEAWLSRAMMNSGAGDLLRAYRRPR